MRLYEPASYVTNWLPLSGTAVVLLMNTDVYESLFERERDWIDGARPRHPLPRTAAAAGGNGVASPPSAPTRFS